MNPDFQLMQKMVSELQAQVKELQRFKTDFEQKQSAPRTYFKNIIAFDKEALIGFFGKDPIKQQAAITAPSGGATVDSQSRTAISTIITTLQTYGLIK